MSDLRISLLQTHLAWEDKPANFLHFENLLQELPPGTDLVLLPEMFSTGFSMNAVILGEPLEGATLEWMRLQARLCKAVIAGSFICEEAGKYYNRLLWVEPDGSFQYYDKRHLFRMGQEHQFYTPGTQQQTVRLKDWKISLQVCYDLRFPVFVRNRFDAATASWEYDLLLYVANWPERRAHHWKALLTARAIENQCFVIGLNRVGTDGNGVNHSGDSRIISSLGETLLDAADRDGIHSLLISKKPLEEHRKNFPVGFDADAFDLRLE